MDIKNCLKVFVMLLFILCTISCSKQSTDSDVKDEEVINDKIYGEYQGVIGGRGDLRKTTWVERIDTGDYNIKINSFFGLTYPGISLDGRLNLDNTINIKTYECNDCTDLPSPGGSPRKYDARMSGEGEFDPDSCVFTINVDYWQTGTQSDSYNGTVTFTKIE